MSRYGKYFLQHILWLDDGFCKYYIQDRALCPQDILDVPCIIFDIRHEAESFLIQCARHDDSTTLTRLRSFLATECLEPLPVHRLDDRKVIQAAARRLTASVHKIVIEPKYGWAVQFSPTAEPLVPVRIEPEPDLEHLIRRLQSALDALVAEQQKKHNRHEARLAAMTPAQRSAAYAQKAASGLYEGTIGSLVGLARLAGSLTLGYWKTLWSLANYPRRQVSPERKPSLCRKNISNVNTWMAIPMILHFDAGWHTDGGGNRKCAKQYEGLGRSTRKSCKVCQRWLAKP
jgi:hypothetical protein